MFYRNIHNVQCDLQHGYPAGREFFFLFKLTYFLTFVQQRSKHTSNSDLRISATCLVMCGKYHIRQKIARQISLDLKKKNQEADFFQIPT